MGPGWSDFADRRGAVYQLIIPAHEAELTLELELEEAELLPLSVRAGGGFRLVFRGPAEPVLPQAIYALGPAGGETLEIFLVPIGRDARGVAYEAIFN